MFRVNYFSAKFWQLVLFSSTFVGQLWCYPYASPFQINKHVRQSEIFNNFIQEYPARKKLSSGKYKTEKITNDTLRHILPSSVSQRKRPRKPGVFIDSEGYDFTAEEKGGHFQGDILLTYEQAKEISDMIRKEHNNKEDGHTRQKRKFTANAHQRWNSNEPIFYKFDGSHSKFEAAKIKRALAHWQALTCLNFKEKNDWTSGSGLIFSSLNECGSYVGKNPFDEPQYVFLEGQECLRLGVIAHEIAHALGFWHDISRPDRDYYVQIQTRNVKNGFLNQFVKESDQDVLYRGIPYDYGSLMHYNGKAFSKDNYSNTILTALNGYQGTIGQRDQLSFNDVRLMNEMYCSHVCWFPLPCQRGGYPNPRDCKRCVCPDGFTGAFCNVVEKNKKCGGTIRVFRTPMFLTSPNYPRRFDKEQQCSWLLQANSDEVIELEFIGNIDLHRNEEKNICLDYVEIRNSTDLSNTGMRFCRSFGPVSLIRSPTNEMLLLFRSFYRSSTGFKAKIKTVKKLWLLRNT